MTIVIFFNFLSMKLARPHPLDCELGLTRGTLFSYFFNFIFWHWVILEFRFIVFLPFDKRFFSSYHCHYHIIEWYHLIGSNKVHNSSSWCFFHLYNTLVGATYGEVQATYVVIFYIYKLGFNSPPSLFI